MSFDVACKMKIFKTKFEKTALYLPWDGRVDLYFLNKKDFFSKHYKFYYFYNFFVVTNNILENIALQ